MSTLASTLARVLGLLGLMSAVTPAAGADSLTCTIDDRTLRLELVGTTNMSGDTRVYVRSGQLTLKRAHSRTNLQKIPIMQATSFCSGYLAARFGLPFISDAIIPKKRFSSQSWRHVRRIQPSTMAAMCLN